MSSRAFAIPVSARSTSTVSSYEPQSSRPPSGFDISNDKLNSARDFTPRLNPEDLISSHIDTKDLVKNSLANVLNSVQSGQNRHGNMDDDFVENEEIVYQPHIKDRTHWPDGTGENLKGTVIDGRVEEQQLQNGLEHPMAEELISSMNDSATKIQRWYRGKRASKLREGEDEVRRFVRTKWQERSDIMERERKERESEAKIEKDRKKIREEKQRMARQAAIEVNIPFTFSLCVTCCCSHSSVSVLQWHTLLVPTVLWYTGNYFHHHEIFSLLFVSVKSRSS